MNTIKVKQVIGSSLDSFGTKRTAFYGIDGKVYYATMDEGWHKDIKPGNLMVGVDRVDPNSNGILDLTFIFNVN